MTFSPRTLLDNLVALQGALAITSPVALSVKHAYKMIPGQDNEPECPAVLNIPRLIGVSHIAGARAQKWEIRSQILMNDADWDIGADIVLAFVEQYLNALSAHQAANGLPVILEATTSGDLTRLEYSGFAYQGIEITTRFSVPLESVTAGL